MGLMRIREQQESWRHVLQVRFRVRTTGCYILRHSHRRPRAREWVDESAEGHQLPYILVRWQRIFRFWPDGVCRYVRLSVPERTDLAHMIDPSRGRLAPGAVHGEVVRAGTFVRIRDEITAELREGKYIVRFVLRFCDPASRRFQLVEHSARPLSQAQSDASDMKFGVGKDTEFAFSTFREMDWRREAAVDLEAPCDVRRRALRSQHELARRP